jgi:hypothetical protein
MHAFLSLNKCRLESVYTSRVIFESETNMFPERHLFRNIYIFLVEVSSPRLVGIAVWAGTVT